MKALANSIQLLEQLRKQNEIEDESFQQNTPIPSDKNYGSIKRFQSNQNPSSFNPNPNSKIPAFDNQQSEFYFNEKNTSYANFSKGERQKNWGEYNLMKENMQGNANPEFMLNEFRKDGEKLIDSISQIFGKARNQQY